MIKKEGKKKKKNRNPTMGREEDSNRNDTPFLLELPSGFALYDITRTVQTFLPRTTF